MSELKETQRVIETENRTRGQQESKPGDGRRLTRIPVSRVNCCNSCWRASLKVLFDHSSRKVNVTGS